ncbi:hypothetical protein FRC08_014972 [Ceratobasidium sp. 394]|nr:hypothetical protein FRC08_014972 [Ceratobasidium sp. 394]
MVRFLLGHLGGVGVDTPPPHPPSPHRTGLSHHPVLRVDTQSSIADKTLLPRGFDGPSRPDGAYTVCSSDTRGACRWAHPLTAVEGPNEFTCASKRGSLVGKKGSRKEERAHCACSNQAHLGRTYREWRCTP